MKKIVLGIFCLFFITGMVNAQQGKKALKEASKSLGSFNSDREANADKLPIALDMITRAMESEELKNDIKAWKTKAQVYAAVADNEVNMRYSNPAYVLTHPKAASVAYDAFKYVLENAEKGGDKKDAIKGLILHENTLNNFGIMAFQAKDYDGAYNNFLLTKEASELLTANDADTRLALPAIMDDLKFFTAISAYYGSNKEASKPLFEELHATGEAQPIVYDALFNMNLKTDEEKAVQYLTEGREKHPEDESLLYGEINYMLQNGKLDDLIGRLTAAAEKDASNPSVLSTLGNVYDQISAREREAGNEEGTKDNFDKALEWYNKALEVDPNNFVATYSIGTLYYNQAAALVEPLNETADDLSAAGTKKYNELKGQMDELFKQALPYFESCEKLNPQDPNTMKALKEIHARNNDFEKVNEYKAKLKALGIE